MMGDSKIKRDEGWDHVSHTFPRHGGKRKGAGRKPSPFISKRVVLHFKSEEEYQRFIESTTPRERVEIVMEQAGIMKWYAIKHKTEKRWTAYQIPESHLKHLKAGYEWRGPFDNLAQALMAVNSATIDVEDGRKR